MKRKYYNPQMQITKIKQVASVLTSSPGNGGGGNLPPTDNDNNDNDW